MAGRPHAEAGMPGGTDVWIVDLAVCGEKLLEIERARSLLTPAETTRAEAMADPARRARWQAAHVALHAVLTARLGQRVQFAASSTGKPRVTDWHGDFSLSHSGALVLIAVREQGRVGIDAETRRTMRIGADRRALIEAAGTALLPEQPLPAGDADMDFLAAWTRLEAIAKMRGTGIGALLEVLAITARSPGRDVVAEHARRLVTDRADPVALVALDVARFDAVATLAMSPPTGAPRLHDLAAELASLGG